MILAHRGQIKVVKNSGPRRNVALLEVATRVRISSKRRFESSDEDESFQSTSSRQVLLPPTPPPVRSEVHPAALQSYNETQATYNDKQVPRKISPQSSDVLELRRSKRFKKKKIDSDYVYTS